MDEHRRGLYRLKLHAMMTGINDIQNVREEKQIELDGLEETLSKLQVELDQKTRQATRQAMDLFPLKITSREKFLEMQIDSTQATDVDTTDLLVQEAKVMVRASSKAPLNEASRVQQFECVSRRVSMRNGKDSWGRFKSCTSFAASCCLPSWSLALIGFRCVFYVHGVTSSACSVLCKQSFRSIRGK